MSVSPICTKGKERYAFVNFTDNSRLAEGKIPDCKIISNKGFNDDEIKQLEEYMKKELLAQRAPANVMEAIRQRLL